MIPYKFNPLGIDSETGPEDALMFTCLEGPCYVALNNYGTPTAVDMYYKKNDGPWTAYPTLKVSINLNEGDTVCFWNKASTFSTDMEDYYHFDTTGSVKVSGNIASLLNYTALKPYCFYKVFCHSTITQIEDTVFAYYNTLAEYCYGGALYNCIGLTSLPENLLPATELADACYEAFCRECLNLVTPCKLPATTLKPYCYKGFYFNCESLTSIYLNAAAWTDNSTSDWVGNVPENVGTFYKNAALTEEFDINRIPVGWTVVNL